MTQLVFSKNRLLLVGILLFTIYLLNLTILEPTAQDNTGGQCTALASTIFEEVNERCEGIGRDQICYGSVSIDAEPNSNASEFTFENLGDIANVADLATLRLQSLNPNGSEWGVALMKVQSSLPDSAPEDVTLLLFGDVQVQNLGRDIVRVPLTSTTGSNVRLRADATGTLIGSIGANQEVVATGKLTNPDGEEWIRIDIDTAPSGFGWVLGALLEGDKSDLINVARSNTPAFGPMQAFTFQTGAGAGECDDITSSSGLVIQTPAGQGEISFFINAVDIQVGSTVFLQAPQSNMSVGTIEGNVTVRSFGITRRVPPGSESNIPLNNNGVAVGEPSLPSPYNDVIFNELESFGISEVFDEEFEILESFSEECLEDYNNEFNDNFDDPFGDEVSSECFLRNYDLFIEEYIGELPAECFADDGTILDECLLDFSDEIPDECLDEFGEISEYCLDANTYFDALPEACYNPFSGDVEDECLGAFDDIYALPDTCFDEFGELIDECLGASGIFYDLPDTCYDDNYELLDECLDSFGDFDEFNEFDDACFDEFTGEILDECLLDDDFTAWLPDACFDEFGGIYDECLDPYEELETIPDDCFDEFGDVADECFAGVIDDDFGYGTIFRNEEGDSVNPYANEFDVYGNPTYNGGYDIYGEPIYNDSDYYYDEYGNIVTSPYGDDSSDNYYDSGDSDYVCYYVEEYYYNGYYYGGYYECY